MKVHSLPRIKFKRSFAQQTFSAVLVALVRMTLNAKGVISRFRASLKRVYNNAKLQAQPEHKALTIMALSLSDAAFWLLARYADSIANLLK